MGGRRLLASSWQLPWIDTRETHAHWLHERAVARSVPTPRRCEPAMAVALIPRQIGIRG